MKRNTKSTNQLLQKGNFMAKFDEFLEAFSPNPPQGAALDMLGAHSTP